MQEKLKIKVKKLSEKSILPSYAKPGDAGMDLTCTSIEYDDFGNMVCHTGLSIEIPDGYVGLLFPRSSISKTDLRLTNSIGVVDSKYRGEVIIKFRNDNFSSTNVLIKNDVIATQMGFDRDYNVGDRIAQLIILPYPHIEFEEVEELLNTDRGTGGFGSTGK